MRLIIEKDGYSRNRTPVHLAKTAIKSPDRKRYGFLMASKRALQAPESFLGLGTTDKGAEDDQVIETVSLDHSLVDGLVLIFLHRNSPSWSLTSMALSRLISCDSHLQGGRRGKEEQSV